MRELLADNISYNQMEDFRVHTSRLCPRVWEVPLLSSWVYCFAAYMAVLTPDPRTREMLAYCRLIFCEALRHWGNGWLEYDFTLRRQAAVDSSMPWHSLVPGLQAANILTPAHLGGSFEQFATSPITQEISVPFRCPASSVFSYWWTVAASSCEYLPPWNQGMCSFPCSCSYRHVCSLCQRDHDCPNAPSGLAPQSVQLGLNRRSPLSRSTR